MFSQTMKHESPTNVRMGAAATSAFVRRRVDFTLVQSMEADEEAEVLVASTHRYLVGGLTSTPQTGPPSPMAPSLWHPHAHRWNV
jgi:hypothetical protein